MCFFCYIICFSFHHGMWILTKYGNLLNEACTLAGYARYFFALGSLFWLFAISFQIRIGLLAIHVNDSRYRFGIYNVFVWGLAALGTSAIFLIDRIWGGDLSTLKWMPSIGFYQCWFHPNDWSILIYFIGPILALNCINWIFFLVAVFQIKKVALNLKKYQTSNSIPQKRRYLKFLRLFVMMGMSWILDFIPYFIRGNVYWQYLFLPVFYYHLSLGSVVFVLFALKSSTRRLVMERIQGRTQSPLVQI
ncbi:probable G-protein coupled receptor Mth-like 6 [Drosophila eugracilis]|uniref:probable G-protein coupled receptor Mth-like 6 n=1 Tax=Drosophila eugracilis TaxID=29029 RepID=UPI0007E82F60|nr:probable G-protein coupled receptor Mth-like 6 [Drosophila eugracilis]